MERGEHATLNRHVGAHGIRKLIPLLDRYLDTADRKSRLEIAFDAYAAADRRIPPYEKNVHMGPWEIDCLFTDHQLALELDGRPYHVAIQDTDRDNAKNTWLQLRGLRVLRITDFQWEYDRPTAVNELVALLALGARREAA